MKLTVDILEDFINSIELTGSVLSYATSGATTTLNVAKTYHARAFIYIDVDGTSYKVNSVVNNQSITIEGTPADPQTYTVPNPHYFHGTPIMTNSHISRADTDQKFPMIYLYEILREKDLNPLSSIRRESDLRLFFLDTCNLEEWSTDDLYTYRLLGLNNLVDEFIEAARKYTCCFYLDDTDFERINRPNWGTFVDMKGNLAHIFDEDCTGIDLSFTLPIKCKN